MSRVLVIDDDGAFRSACVSILRNEGYEAIGARNGADAIRLLDKIEVDLVITDILMPEKDGIETIQELKRSHSAIKVIAVSGGGAIGEASLCVCRSLGAAILRKPFSTQELRMALAAATAVDANDVDLLT